MSVLSEVTLSSNLNDIDAIRLIKFSQSNKALGITNQLGHNWLWQDKYPIPVRKFNGCNYVRYCDLIAHLESLFSNLPSKSCNIDNTSDTKSKPIKKNGASTKHELIAERKTEESLNKLTNSESEG